VTKAELITGLAASNPHLRRPDVELIVATIFDQITGAPAPAAAASNCVVSAPSR
jgi:integration host factor subunit beta